jgi:hypothetical protein
MCAGEEDRKNGNKRRGRTRQSFHGIIGAPIPSSARAFDTMHDRHKAIGFLLIPVEKVVGKFRSR